jgi:hypothetical protein
MITGPMPSRRKLVHPAQQAESRGRLRRRLAVLPGPLRRLVVAGLMLGYLALSYGALMLFQYWRHPGALDWEQPAAVLAGGFLGALLGASLVRWGRHRRAGEAARARRRTFDTAARTGRLPADVDPGVWRPLLAERQLVQRRRTVLALAVEAVVAVLLPILVLVADGSFPAVVVGLVIPLQVMSLTWAAGERRRRRVAGMIERLFVRAGVDQSAER